MDFLFELLPLFFVVWVLLRALRRRPAPGAPEQPAAPSGPRELTPFEELVKRIEAAAAEAERQKANAGAPPPPLAASPRRTQAAKRPRLAARPTDEFRSQADEFRSQEETPHSKTGEFRSLEAPASEPEFHPIYDLTPEERALHESHRVVPGPAPSARMPSSLPPSDRRPPPVRSRLLHPLVAQLHEPEAARIAFLMKEVMGERRGARRDPRD